MVSAPSSGSLTLNPDGSFTYTSDAAFSGDDSFSYLAFDGQAYSDATTVVLTVNSVNEVPTAVNDIASTDPGSAVTLNVLANDSDPDGDTLELSSVSDPSHGTVVFNADETVTYTPDPSFQGTDSFSYTIDDGHGGQAGATVYVGVGNTPPTAQGDSYTLDHATLAVGAAGVLANDSDPDGDPLQSVLVTDVTNGQLSLQSDGSFNYLPNPGFVGTDSFTYYATDGVSQSTPVSVSLVVPHADSAPVADDAGYSVNENFTLTVSAAEGVLASTSDADADLLHAVLLTEAAHGSVDLADDGSFVYYPDPDYSGPDSFSYQVSDGALDSNVGVVSLTVNPSAGPLTAVGDTASVNEDDTLTLDVMANDVGLTGETAVTGLDTTSTSGQAWINPDGTVSYTPTAGFVGQDQFDYTIADDRGNTSSAAVQVTVVAVNHPPQANDDAEVTEVGQALTVAVLANDSDPDGDPLTVTDVAQGVGGTTVLNADQTVTYTPDDGFQGWDSFIYTVSDGRGSTDTATVDIFVLAAGSAQVSVVATDPTASRQPAGAPQDPGTFTFTRQGGDLDAPLDVYFQVSGTANHPPLSFQDASYQPELAYTALLHGKVHFDANQAVVNRTITPVFNEIPEHDKTIIVTLSALPFPDQPPPPQPEYELLAGQTQATVTITGVNRPPTANPDSFQVDDGAVNAPLDVLANDSDPDTDALTITAITQPLFGSVSIAPGSTRLLFTPEAGQYGDVTFGYTVSDGWGGTSSAAVTVTVQPTPPVITWVSPDTGLSPTDRWTKSQNLTVGGSAGANEQVTVLLGDNVIGTTQADAGGNWSFDYSKTTLPVGVHTFTAFATLADGLKTRRSDPFEVTVDPIPPVVKLAVLSSEYATTPEVRVTTEDNFGTLPNGTVVLIDADLNNNGNFNDPGEAGYTTAVLHDGWVQFVVKPGFSLGSTTRLRARVQDAAGNMGYSNVEVISSLTEDRLIVRDESQVSSQAGTLSLSHPLDLDLSPGTDMSRNAALVYSSSSADQRPIFQVSIETRNDQPLPAFFVVLLDYLGTSLPPDAGTFEGATRNLVNYRWISTAGYSPGDLITFSIQQPTPINKTGRFLWNLEVGQADEISYFQTIWGKVPNRTSINRRVVPAYIVAPQDSPVAPGWNFSFTDRLVSVGSVGPLPAGLLRVTASGAQFYAQLGAESITQTLISAPPGHLEIEFQSLPGDFGTLYEDLVLFDRSQSTYHYIGVDGSETIFDASGRLLSWEDDTRTSEMTFRYGVDADGDGVANDILITALDGSQTAVIFKNGRVDRIVAPGNRTTTLVPNAAGDLNIIRDPNQSEDVFAYNNRHQVVTRDAVGGPQQVGNLQIPPFAYRDSWEYGVSGLLTRHLAGGTGLTYIDTSVFRDRIGANGQRLGFPTDIITDPLGHQTRITSFHTLSRNFLKTKDGGGNAVIVILPSEYSYLCQVVVGPDGSTSWSNRDSQGLVFVSVDAQGQATYTYYYIGTPFPQFMELPNGSLREWDYEEYKVNGLSRFRLTRYTDELGHATSYGYYDNGELKTVTNALNQVTTYTYWATADARNGQVKTVTDALGNTVSSNYDSYGRLASVTYTDGTREVYKYDDLGNPLASMDRAGRWTKTRYDVMGRLVRQEDWAGNISQYIYDTGGMLRFQIDPTGVVTEYDYNRSRQVVSQIATLDGVTLSSLRTLYDRGGNPVQTVDLRGRVTQTRFDAAGRAVQLTEAVGTPLQRRTLTSYLWGGRVWQQVDPLGLATLYSYVDLDEPSTTYFGTPTSSIAKVKQMAVGTTQPETQQGFDVAGNQLWAEDPVGGVTLYHYDKLGRQDEVIAAYHTPAEQRTKTTFDADGREQTVTDPHGVMTLDVYDDRLDLQWTVEAVGTGLERVTATAQDGLGRTTAVRGPDGNVSVTRYFDSQSRVDSIDPGPAGFQRVTSTWQDAAGRTVLTIDPLGVFTADDFNDVLGLQVETVIGRDGEGVRGVLTQSATQSDRDGNTRVVTDADGNTTVSVLDALGRQVAEVSALGVRLFGYDRGDDLLWQIDRDGRETDFAYGPVHQRQAELWLDSQGDVLERMSFDYYANGSLRTASDNAASYLFIYDGLGRTTQVRQTGTAGLPGFTVNWQYDLLPGGLHDEQTLTLGGVVDSVQDSYTDPLGRVWRLTQSGGDAEIERVDLTYTALDQLKTISRFAGPGATSVAQTVYGYDGLSRLASITTNRPGGLLVAQYGYGYDVYGRLRRFSSPDGTTDYSYDDLGQLTAAGEEGFGYDPSGNRTGDGAQIDAGNLLRFDGRNYYEYDKEGNRTAKLDLVTGEVTTYTWDYRNRLTQVTTVSGATVTQANYSYDVLDRRVRADVTTVQGGVATRQVQQFLYSGDNIALVLDGLGSVTNRYLHGPGADLLLADEQITAAGDEAFWALTDHLGTVRQLMDSQANVVKSLSFGAFGNITADSAPSVAELYAFTGREWDPAAGLYYYRARWYDAAAGRFVSPDPTGFRAGDLNLSRYVANSPTTLTDPSGKILPLIALAFASFAVYGILRDTVDYVDRGIHPVGAVGLATMSNLPVASSLMGVAEMAAGISFRANDFGAKLDGSGYAMRMLGIAIDIAAPHIGRAFGRAFGAWAYSGRIQSIRDRVRAAYAASFRATDEYYLQNVLGRPYVNSQRPGMLVGGADWTNLERTAADVSGVRPDWVHSQVVPELSQVFLNRGTGSRRVGRG